MSFLESLLYGFISGISEFVPVSSQAYQAIILRLFGLNHREPARDVFVHIAVLLALVTACKPLFSNLAREQRLSSNNRRRRTGDRRSAYDLRLFKSAAFPLVLGLICYATARKIEANLIVLSVICIINGIIIMIPDYARHGNKDGRFMTGLDGILLGVFGALSAVPGISRIASVDFYSTLRGVDRNHSLNWSFLLSIPALFLFIVFDIINLFTLPLGAVTFVTFLYYLLSAIAAYCGGYLSIMLVRYLAVHTGFVGFAYYSWGTAMFTFVLYLIV